ncbi:OV-17 antigen [Dirofilaria immitis]|nr:OV-17 antigen [Dirofilaria immitis]
MKFLILFSSILIVAIIAQQQQQQQQQEQLEVPPFLVGAPQSVIKQFYDLLKADETKTDAQTEADVEAFINRLGGTYKTRFDQFKQEIKQGKAAYERLHQQAVAKFSKEAREADAKMSAIADSPSLTTQQKLNKFKLSWINFISTVNMYLLEYLN